LNMEFTTEHIVLGVALIAGAVVIGHIMRAALKVLTVIVVVVGLAYLFTAGSNKLSVKNATTWIKQHTEDAIKSVRALVDNAIRK